MDQRMQYALGMLGLQETFAFCKIQTMTWAKCVLIELYQ